MKLHPAYAFELLNPIPYLRPTLTIHCSHDEKSDSPCYPLGLDGEVILRAARSFAVVDVWDAVTHD